MWRRREEERLLEEEDRWHWEERRRYERECEFLDRCRRYPPPLLNMPPPMVPPGMPRPSVTPDMPPPMIPPGMLHLPFTPDMLRFPFMPGMPPMMPMQHPDYSDDRHVLDRHANICSQDKEHGAIQKIASNTEKTLKIVSEQLTEKVSKKQSLSPQNYHPPPPPKLKQAKKERKCHICGQMGHNMGFCRMYKKGPKMRERLQQLGRCDQCLQQSKDHSEMCRTLSSPCKTCGDLTHFSITCDGTPHPGSWIVKMKKSVRNKQNSNILDIAVSDFLEAPSLENWNNDMEKHFNYMERLADRILKKDISQEYFLIQTFLHRLPEHLRQYLERNLPKNKKDYTFENISIWINKYKDSTTPTVAEVGTQSH